MIPLRAFANVEERPFLPHADCPVCHNPSLRIGESGEVWTQDGKQPAHQVIWCEAGCPRPSILRAVRCGESDLLLTPALDAEQREVAAEVASMFAQEKRTEAAPDVTDPVEILTANRPFGRRLAAATRLLPTLHRATREGLPAGALVFITGPPGSGKTSLATQLGEAAALRDNAAMIGLYQDEGRERAAVRIGQLLGFNRDRLEDQDAGELSRFRAELPKGSIHLYDADRDSIASAARKGREAAEGRDVVLIIDSIQSVRSGSDDQQQSEGERGRVTGTVEQARREADRGALVVATSEINRASYRHKRDEDNSDPLTAGAETRSIEFKADLIIHLSGDDPDAGPVRARVIKNRIGSGHPKFRLQFDRATTSFAEVDEAGAAQETAETDREALAAAAAKIIEVLTNAKAQGVRLNSTEFERLCGGNRAMHLKARAQEAGKTIVSERDGRQNVWRLR